MANLPTITNNNLRLLSNANSVLDQVLALLKNFPGFPSIVENLTVTGTLTAHVGGDLFGSLPNPKVVGLQNIPILNTLPTTGQVLTFNGTKWAPAATSGSGTVTGDLSGSVPGAITVIGLDGNPLTASSPNAGDVLQWNGTDWLNTPPPGSQALPQPNLFSTGIIDTGQTNVFLPVYSTTAISGEVTNPGIALSTGKVLITYGNGSGGACSLYDPAAGTLTATGTMTGAPNDPQLVLLNNGNVLAVNNAASTTQIYNTGLGTWSNTGSLPFNVNNIGNTIVALNDGTALLYTYNSGSTALVAAIYDPVATTWTSTANAPTFVSLTGTNPTVLANGNVLIPGPSGNWDLYNPITQLFSSTGSSIMGTNNGCTILLSNGKVLLTAGFSSNNSELYDPVAQTWSNTGNLPQSGNLFSMVTYNGGVFLVGFASSGPSPYFAAFYNIGGGTWSSITFPASSSLQNLYNVLTTLSGGNIFAVMGNGGSNTELVIFMASVGTWTSTGGTLSFSSTDTTTGYSLSNYEVTVGTPNSSFQFNAPGWGGGVTAGDYVFSCYIRATALTSFGVNLNINGSAGTTVQLTPTIDQYIRVWFPFTFPGGMTYKFGINFTSLPLHSFLSVGLFSITQGRIPIEYTYPGNSSESNPYVHSEYFGTSFPTSTAETYKQGDIVWATNAGPSAMAWVCTTAGSPGTWTAISTGGGGGGSVTGDLSGTVPGSITVTGLQSHPVSSSSPSSGQVLTWGGSSWAPQTPTTTGSAGGDLTGTYPNPTIANLQGNPVSASGAITTGYALTWSGSAWIPASVGTSSTPTGPAGGDLAGSYPNPTINTIHLGNLNLGVSGGTSLLNPALLFNAANGTSAKASSIEGVSNGSLSFNISGPEYIFNISGTAAAELTTTKLQLSNGVLGVYQINTNSSLTLQSNSNSGGNGIILNNAVNMTSGNLLIIENNTAVAAQMDFEGDLTIGLLDSTHPSLTIGNTAEATAQDAIIYFNTANSFGNFQSTVVGANKTLYYTSQASHVFQFGTVYSSSTPVAVIGGSGTTPENGYVASGHLISANSSGTSPTVPTVNTLWGTGASANTVGGDSAMILTVTTGTGPGSIPAGTSLFTVQFNSAWASSNYAIMVAPQFASVTPGVYYAVPSSATQFDVYSTTNTVVTGTPSGTTFNFQIIAMGCATSY